MGCRNLLKMLRIVIVIIFISWIWVEISAIVLQSMWSFISKSSSMGFRVQKWSLDCWTKNNLEFMNPVARIKILHSTIGYNSNFSRPRINKITHSFLHQPKGNDETLLLSCMIRDYIYFLHYISVLITREHQFEPSKKTLNLEL